MYMRTSFRTIFQIIWVALPLQVGLPWRQRMRAIGTS
jgi:hypothetical protein